MASLYTRFGQLSILKRFVPIHMIRYLASGAGPRTPPSPADFVEGMRRMERTVRELMYGLGSRAWPFNTNWWQGGGGSGQSSGFADYSYSGSTPGLHWASEDTYVDESGRKVWRWMLDMSCFKPEDIEVKTQGRRLVIKAKHYTMDSRQDSTRYDYERERTLPNGVSDVKSIRSRYTNDGRLVVEADYVNGDHRDEQHEQEIPVKHT